ncbi:MAG TPA: hypothetical protein VF247_12525, partial [Candidatus Krumholzibacteria bacterium]
MPVRPAIRSSARFLILLVLLGGCSRAVTVSPRELAPASRWTGRYRIITVDDSFAAREFAVTDSTIVITELNSSDSRFGRTRMPLTVPLRDVRS